MITQDNDLTAKGENIGIPIVGELKDGGVLLLTIAQKGKRVLVRLIVLFLQQLQPKRFRVISATDRCLRQTPGQVSKFPMFTASLPFTDL